MLSSKGVQNSYIIAPGKNDSKSLKIGMPGAWQVQEFRRIAKYVVGAGVREGYKNLGRRGGFEEGLK